MKEQEYNKEFGRKLQEQRRKKDLTLRELHETSGIHYVNISKIENGLRPVGIQTAIVLVNALGLEGKDRDDLLALIHSPRQTVGVKYMGVFQHYIYMYLKEKEVYPDNIAGVDCHAERAGIVFTIILRNREKRKVHVSIE